MADYEKDFEGTKPDGILGLSNNKRESNIFDLAYESGQLISPIFAFDLGLRVLKQPSYFYYNITAEDFPTAKYVKATRNNYWTIPVISMKVEDESYEVSEALIDTGTSLIILPGKAYAKMETQVFSKTCAAYSSTLLVMQNII